GVSRLFGSGVGRGGGVGCGVGRGGVTVFSGGRGVGAGGSGTGSGSGASAGGAASTSSAGASEGASAGPASTISSETIETGTALTICRGGRVPPIMASSTTPMAAAWTTTDPIRAGPGRSKASASLGGGGGVGDQVQLDEARARQPRHHPRHGLVGRPPVGAHEHRLVARPGAAFIRHAGDQVVPVHAALADVDGSVAVDGHRHRLLR